MKKIFIIVLIFITCGFYTNAEDAVYFNQVPINFTRLEDDTLDNLIASKSKKMILIELDSNITNLKNSIKHSTNNIKDEDLAFQLIGLNKAYNLKIDSFLKFSEQLNLSGLFYSVYNQKLGDTTEVIKNIKNALEKNHDLSKDFIDGIYYKYTRIGFFTFCNYTNDLVKQSSIDTLYKVALIYPNEVRNEYYYALAEFDRNCGNSNNNSKYYKDLLYNKMKDAMSLEKALTDTSEVNSLNYTNYILTPKYQFLAYSLYAKNFDIKANQKEIIYFLSSQNKEDGGFKEFNLEKAEKTIKSNINPTFYAFWALLELREQINALYPDEVEKPIPITPKTNNYPSKNNKKN